MEQLDLLLLNQGIQRKFTIPSRSKHNYLELQWVYRIHLVYLQYPEDYIWMACHPQCALQLHYACYGTYVGVYMQCTHMGNGYLATLSSYIQLHTLLPQCRHSVVVCSVRRMCITYTIGTVHCSAVRLQCPLHGTVHPLHIELGSFRQPDPTEATITYSWSHILSY